MKIILSMEQSRLNMVLNKENLVVFLDEKLIDFFDEAIYFRATESEYNLLLGEAKIFHVYNLHYTDKLESSNNLTRERQNELTHERYRAIKHLYFNWCVVKSITPNYNEGWFKSKKFMAYLDSIGWGGNYAIFLDNIKKYNSPQNISDILNQGNLIEITETQEPLKLSVTS